MRFNHEALLVTGDAPSPKQLFELAVCGVALARQHDKLRIQPQGGYVKAAVLPFAESLPSVEEGVPRYSLSRQMALRLARSDLGGWSMRIISRQHFTREEVGEDGSLQTSSQIDTYGFGWDRHNTTMAWRQLRALPSVGPETDLADDIDRFTVSDDLAALWHARTQLETVTGDDLPELMSEMQQYADGALLLC